MKQMQVEFTTGESTESCAQIFQQAINASYGGKKKLLRGITNIGVGGGVSGVEFFTPEAGDDPFSGFGSQPTWKAGAHMPGYNKLNGATRVGVLIFVFDKGDHREVQLVSPYSMGDKGSSEKVLRTVASAFGQ
jgi:hypothetical protein